MKSQIINLQRTRKTRLCELCFKKRKIYAHLRFGQLWRFACKKCFKEYVKISNEYQFVK